MDSKKNIKNSSNVKSLDGVLKDSNTETKGVEPKEENINTILSDDGIFVEIFKFLGGYGVLATAKPVCKLWVEMSKDELLWHEACMQLWPNKRLRLTTLYTTWNGMFFKRPHVRFDGVYVLKRTYAKRLNGQAIRIAMRQHRKIITKCSYYRYLRFMDDGRVIYALLNDNPKKALPWINEDDKRVHIGRYLLVKRGVHMECDLGYIKIKMALEFGSVNPGAFSRLEMKHFVGRTPNDLEPHRFEVPQYDDFQFKHINNLDQHRKARLEMDYYDECKDRIDMATYDDCA